MLSAKEKQKVLNYITKQFVDIRKSRDSESESCGAQNFPKKKMDLQKFRHEIVIWLSTYETSLRNHRIIHISINFYTRKLTAERSNIKIRGKHVDWT